jgi:hypothetical protein
LDWTAATTYKRRTADILRLIKLVSANENKVRWLSIRSAELCSL